jgi:threonine/homoserine/homoserine lactone efflux protein
MDNIPALIVATALLVMIPGPNVALIVATSLRRGLRQGLLTVLGTTVGVGIQLALVVAGLATLLEAAAEALHWLKWVGAAYLVYLGIRAWRRAAQPPSACSPEPGRRAAWRGTMLAVLNPKTLLFNAAFLPQFVGSTTNATSELILLSAVYLLVIATGDMLWALFARSVRGWLEQRVALRERATGALLVAAGTGLAVAARRDA